MPEAGELRYEIVEEDLTLLPLLYVYLPEELSSRDVTVSTGVAEVAVEHVSSGRILGLIELKGYQLSDEDDAAKYSKKHRRFTIRLTRVAAAAAAGGAPAPSSRKGSPTPAAAALGGGNSFGVLDNDDVSDDNAGADGEGAAGAGKKKKKKKKKGKKGAGAAEGEGEGEAAAGEAAATVGEAPTANGNGDGSHGAGGGGSSSGDEGESAAGAGGEGAAGAAKKKKKKKKGAAGGEGADGQAAVGEAEKLTGGDDAEVAAEEAGLPERASQPPTPVPGSAPASVPGSAAMSKSASRAVVVDVETDFGEEPSGKLELGCAVDHDPLLGPALHHAMHKTAIKGEDKWMEAPSNAWSWLGTEGATPVSAFGIFDGHGGRMAAQHTAKQLLPLVARYAERAFGGEPPSERADLEDAGYLEDDGDGEQEGEALQRARLAAAQDALISRLPKALHTGFVACDAEIVGRYKESGTTATLAVQVGWELLVANVGDSLAYLDTGTEIVAVSANHRVAESSEEQERILAAGGRIKPAALDEDEEAPPVCATPHEGGRQLRVWPGGINMTRTIGDASSKGLLIAEPAVRQVSLPVTGARLIIASDGLWDAVNAKTIIGQLRTYTAREAASRAAVYAMRQKKHDDDVTVIVADFVPRTADSHVPGLLKRMPSAVATALATLASGGLREERTVQCWRPLETPSESWRERHRAHRRRAAAFLGSLAEAEAAEAEAAEAAERQRSMAVAPPAGTAGLSSVLRMPVSETYRELVGLRVNVDDLKPGADGGADDGGKWEEVVDNKKKKDAGGFSLQRELAKAARPSQTVAPPGGAQVQGGGGEGRPEGGRRERRDRNRDRDRERPPRRDRGRDREQEAAAGGAAAAEHPAATAVAAAGDEAGEGPAGEPQEQQQQQQQPRGERPPRERRERREGGGRGGRGPRGASGQRGEAAPGGGRGGAAAAAAAAAPAPAPSAGAPHYVKSGGVLLVPKSLISAAVSGGVGDGSQVGAVPPVAASGGYAGQSVEGGGGDAPGASRRGRKDRNRDRPRREDAAEAQPEAAGERGAAEEAEADGSGGHRGSGAKRNAQRRAAKEKKAMERKAMVEDSEVAVSAVGAAMEGLGLAAAPRAAAAAPPAGAPAAARSHLPATSSSDPVVVPAPAHQRRAAGHVGPRERGHQAAQQQQQHEQPQQQAAAPRHPAASHAPAGGHYAQAQYPEAQHYQHQQPPHQQYPQQDYQQRPPPHQQHYQQQQQHQAPAAQHHAPRAQAPAAPAAAVAPPPAVPTYAGPMDFGAGFGPGSGMWPPANGGGFGVPGGHVQRNPEVAAAAAAAAAAAVARKAAAAGRGSGGGAAAAPGGAGPAGGRGHSGQYAVGRG